MRRRPWRRGFALADFVAGSLIVTATLVGFTALTRAKMQVLGDAQRRTAALAASEAALDRLRLEGLPVAPKGEADKLGYRQVSTFKPAGYPTANGTIDARALRMAVGEAHLLYEARVSITWRSDDNAENVIRLSTVTNLPGAPR